jgi:hypothetical protein
MESRDLLICNSNMFVPYVLSEILENKEKKYIVISDTKNIVRFFHELTIDNIVFYEYGGGRVWPIHLQKLKMKLFLSAYIINRIVFYHAEFGELANWLLLKYAKQNIH